MTKVTPTKTSDLAKKFRMTARTVKATVVTAPGWTPESFKVDVWNANSTGNLKCLHT